MRLVFRRYPLEPLCRLDFLIARRIVEAEKRRRRGSRDGQVEAGTLDEDDEALLHGRVIGRRGIGSDADTYRQAGAAVAHGASARFLDPPRDQDLV